MTLPVIGMLSLVLLGGAVVAVTVILSLCLMLAVEGVAKLVLVLWHLHVARRTTAAAHEDQLVQRLLPAGTADKTGHGLVLAAHRAPVITQASILHGLKDYGTK